MKGHSSGIGAWQYSQRSRFLTPERYPSVAGRNHVRHPVHPTLTATGTIKRTGLRVLQPMLASTQPPTTVAEWAFEPKLDGWLVHDPFTRREAA
ncbi:MAG: hypothetical protein QOG65_2202 [Actinomycetota bacterium]|nr:hypothetical protein [Actinomycetota bacterium]MDQ1384823.1 hypothetical protein [Actinomycetota bacterium]